MKIKKYFKGKTFFVLFESKNGKESFIQYIEKGLSSRQGFFDWINEKYKIAKYNSKGGVIILDCKIIDT